MTLLRHVHALALAATLGALGTMAPTGAWAAPAAVADAGWASLTPAQRKALAPLAGQWHALDGTSRAKWIKVADRFPRLSAADQQRMQARMTEWSRLPAQQRGEARLRFQNTRQLTPKERQDKWAAYQALPAEERQNLAQQARRKQKPVMLRDAEPGPREASQQATLKSRQRAGRPLDASGKANLVPNPLHASPAPEAVAPTVVKAGPGATTSLVTRPASPPLHQHTGLPKIAATKGFVDPQTLLPRKGPQGAGMTPVQETP